MELVPIKKADEDVEESQSFITCGPLASCRSWDGRDDGGQSRVGPRNVRRVVLGLGLGLGL